MRGGVLSQAPQGVSGRPPRGYGPRSIITESIFRNLRFAWQLNAIKQWTGLSPASSICPLHAHPLLSILNVFSPADFAEFSRILSDTGKLVIASPGPRHLNGLREIIYPNAREHAQSAMIEQARGLFSLSTATRINYPLELKSAGEIMDLLAMTPYFWNIDLNTRSRVEALDRLALDVDVEVRVFEKTKG